MVYLLNDSKEMLSTIINKQQNDQTTVEIHSISRENYSLHAEKINPCHAE